MKSIQNRLEYISFVHHNPTPPPDSSLDNTSFRHNSLSTTILCLSPFLLASTSLTLPLNHLQYITLPRNEAPLKICSRALRFVATRSAPSFPHFFPPHPHQIVLLHARGEEPCTMSSGRSMESRTGRSKQRESSIPKRARGTANCLLFLCKPQDIFADFFSPCQVTERAENGWLLALCL